MGISSPLPPAGFINSSVPGNPHPTSTRPRTLSWGPTSTSPCPTVVSQVAMYPLTLPNPNPNPKPKRHSLGSDRTRTAVEFLSGELKRAFWANYDPRNYGPKPISSLRGILRRLFSILITIHRHRHPPHIIILFRASTTGSSEIFADEIAASSREMRHRFEEQEEDYAAWQRTRFAG